MGAGADAGTQHSGVSGAREAAQMRTRKGREAAETLKFWTKFTVSIFNPRLEGVNMI